MDQGKEGANIVLVRHAMPVIDSTRPAGEWLLADDAMTPTIQLAEQMRPLGVDGIVSSPEPKAVGTARLLAGHLDLPFLDDDALREQGGNAIPWYPEPEEFAAAVRSHFEIADRVVLGDESSADAARRFSGAVDRALSRFRFPVIVTHGRVMCGYVGLSHGIDPMSVWETLRLPDAFVLERGSGTLTRIEGKG